MPVTPTYDGNVPTVGADTDTWGGEINTALTQVKADLDAIATLLNSVETTASSASSLATQAAYPGDIRTFARSTAPTGWLVCNGAAVSRATYSALFAAIGTTFGVGDGSTTFNLPDARGVFLRGWDNGRGLDPARSFGSYQADDLVSHTHSVPEGAPSPPAFGGAYTSGDDMTNSVQTNSTSGATGGSETRPKNLAVLICIKT